MDEAKREGKAEKADAESQASEGFIDLTAEVESNSPSVYAASIKAVDTNFQIGAQTDAKNPWKTDIATVSEGNPIHKEESLPERSFDTPSDAKRPFSQPSLQATPSKWQRQARGKMDAVGSSWNPLMRRLGGVGFNKPAATTRDDRSNDMHEARNELSHKGATDAQSVKPQGSNERLVVPLADKVRPVDFDSFVGNSELFGEGCFFRKLIETDTFPSMILWGPCGSGKTTLAGIIAKLTKSKFLKLSAVTCGVTDIRKVVEEAKGIKQLLKKNTILFLDEIHRFNKSQQDSLLEFVENGTIKLIGATTENPSFEVNNALLSRCKVCTLKKLGEDDIAKIITRASDMENCKLSEEVLKKLSADADGDARVALNLLEVCINVSDANMKSSSNTQEHYRVIERDVLDAVLINKSHLVYDRAGENHYNFISALHKSVRGGDKDAAIYYLARMLEAGEDPLYVARRVIRMSTEDIGLGNPMALGVCVSAYQACYYIGMPECSSALTMAVVYLCECPKSNAIEIAYNTAKKILKEHPDVGVPLHLRNAPTKLTRQCRYGEGYVYTNQPHIMTAEQHRQTYDGQTYLPPSLAHCKIFPQM